MLRLPWQEVSAKRRPIKPSEAEPATARAQDLTKVVSRQFSSTVPLVGEDPTASARHPHLPHENQSGVSLVVQAAPTDGCAATLASERRLVA